MRHLVSYWLDACVGPPAVSLILSSEMAPPHSRKKLAYTTKLEIVQAIEKGEKKSALAKKYGVNESTIRTVYKNKKIRKVVRASPAQTPIFHSFRVKNTAQGNGKCSGSLCSQAEQARGGALARALVLLLGGGGGGGGWCRLQAGRQAPRALPGRLCGVSHKGLLFEGRVVSLAASGRRLGTAGNSLRNETEKKPDL